MPRNFGFSRHEQLPRAFDLNAWSYGMDFVLVPVAVAALLWHAARGHGAATILVALMIGAGVWSLAEYWIHRLVFHGPTPLRPMHDMHHRLPKDWIGAASWTTFAGFGLVWLIASLCTADGGLASAFLGGFMGGYLIYCGLHVRMHHGRVDRFGRYVTFMYQHHVGHHRGGRGNFGVSSPIWDVVFNTYRKEIRS